MEGCYELNHQKEPSDFYAASVPIVTELQEVLLQIIRKITKYLERQKIIIKEENQDFQLAIDDEDTLSKLQASSVIYRFATGKSKGKKALVLSSIPDTDHDSKKGLVANNV